MSGTVLNGPLLLAIPLAVLAGLVSFASPCVLPLVPGYLGYVTGLTGTDLEQQQRGRMLAGVALFVAGFSTVYVTVGWLAGAAGEALIEQREILTRVLGGITIVLGLVFAGVFGAALPWLQRDRHLDLKPSAGLVGAPLLGIVFGLGWSPCIGPTLAAIVSLSGDLGDPGRGALLAAAYCLGLGVPFLVAALAYGRAMAVFGALRRHRVAITRAGGFMIAGLGVLLVTGWWGDLIARAQGMIVNFTPVI